MPQTNIAHGITPPSEESWDEEIHEKIVADDDPGVNTARSPYADRGNGGFLLSRRGLSSSCPVRDLASRAQETTYLPLVSDGEITAERETRVVGFPALPRLPRARATFHALQEWEGVVVGVGNAEFQARLVDLTAKTQLGEEEATIPMVEVSDHDVTKVRDGSVFRWVIGYERSAIGQKKRVSVIVFRDLPAVTQSDLRRGEEWASSILQALDE